MELMLDELLDDTGAEAFAILSLAVPGLALIFVRSETMRRRYILR